MSIMNFPIEKARPSIKPAEPAEDSHPHPLQITAREERSAFAVAYGLFYVAGFLFGLMVGWLLWKQ